MNYDTTSAVEKWWLRFASSIWWGTPHGDCKPWALKVMNRIYEPLQKIADRISKIGGGEVSGYEDWTAHELLHAILIHYGAKPLPDSDKDVLELESALRKAVVREESVGVGTVRRAGESPLPDAPQMFVPWETKDGDYYLIPKETP